jgi:MFS family permease
LASVTYGIQPHGGDPTGWTNPAVRAGLLLGLLLMVTFVVIETRVAEPMFRLGLFRIRAFAAGSNGALLVAVARGGMQFMMIIWLQGIWLPLHGHDFIDTPLWAGIYMLPLTAGFVVAGPLSGRLSDRYGPRWFATGGMLLMAAAFVGLLRLPVVFAFSDFAVLLFLSDVGQGMFSAPNTSAMMSSVPAEHRGAASGMRSTFQNSGTALSIGVFFSLMTAGLAGSLPTALTDGLVAHGAPHTVAVDAAHLPPVSTLFSAFLGTNPIHHLLAPSGVLPTLAADDRATRTGKAFFPLIISGPFHEGLIVVFASAATMAVIAAFLSLAVRGARPTDS